MLAIGQARSRELATAKERFRSLYTFNPDGVFALDPRGIFVGVNRAAEEITGLREADIVGQHFSTLVEARDHPQTQEHFMGARDGEVQAFELSLVDASGDRHELDVINMPIVVEGQVTGVYGIARDVTRRKQQETRLRILERSLEASINGVIIADASRPDHPIIYVNAAFMRISGYSREEALGHNCRFLQGPDTDPAAVDRLRQALAEEREVQATLRNYRKDGSPFWNDLFISPVKDLSGAVTHYVGVQNDISQNRDYEDRLAYHASHDALTGLANRSLLEDRLRHDLILAGHSERLLAVLLFDVDDLNTINDSLGHAIGDRLLVEVARRLRDELRTLDTLARLGSDEFVVLMPDLESEEAALAFADSLLGILSRPYCIEEEELVVTVSIGLSFSADGVDDPTTLLQQADLAMRRAKKLGRNTCRTYTSEIDTQVSQRLALRRDMQAAIEGRQFELHYQPLVCARSARVTGFEALLRWRHPVHGYVSPGVFIPLAEETGQIVPISEWVLERACRDLSDLRCQGFGELRVAVNLSPLQFQRPGFLDTLSRILASSGLPARCLELELTEGILLEDTELAIERLFALQEMGIGASIDDFGTGYSSLSYLKHLPIGKLKIDRSFVQELASSERDVDIVSGIIAMAHRLGLTVVAEGVENEKQRRILEDQGCDLYQGFLFARPMPLGSLQAFLENGCLAAR
nr:EAL domain-containing protein [Halomonas campaniensis]